MRAPESAGDKSKIDVISTASRTTSAAHAKHRGRNRLMAACPHAQAFLEKVALHGGHLGGTTSRLLRLLDSHGPSELDFALDEAHRRGAFSTTATRTSSSRSSAVGTRRRASS
jgi:hypothetical protein